MLNDTGSKGKWAALLAALLGWMFDGFEMGLFPLAGRPALRAMLSAHVPAAELEGAVGVWFSWIIATFLLGAAAGGVLFGWLGDRVGRVKAMVWSVAVYSIFSGLCGLVGAPWHLMTLRFIASLGMGGEWALGVALVMEMWPSTSRPIMAGLIGAAANVGYLLVGYLNLGLDAFVGQVGSALGSFLPETWVKSLLAAGGWRLLFVVGSLPAILTFLIRIFVPESEKWKQASEGASKPRVAEIFAPGIKRSTLLGATLAGLALMGTWGSVQWIPAWSDSFSQGAKGVKAWSQIYMSYGAILFTIVAALAAQRTGRRIAYFVLCLASLIICQYLFRSKPVYGSGFLWTVFFAGGLTAAFYGWLPLYLPELFPTRVRATGSGFCFNIGRVLAAAGSLVSGQLVKAFDGDYGKMAATISLIYVAGLVVIWLCPETKGKPLPE